jgi:hypothetical protein
MKEELRMSYQELCERLQGDIGRQIRRLAVQSYTVATTAQSEYRGERIAPRGTTEAIVMLAIQDFLDLCFGQSPDPTNSGPS